MSLLAIAAESAMTFPEWSPALFEIDLGFLGLGKFPIRWYALGYIAGLLFAWRYALSLIKRPALWGEAAPTDKDGIDDLLFYATLGVILGGRLGYLFFYDIPNNMDQIAADPMRLLRIWEGGMSFHGGMIGVALAVVWVARQRGVKLMSIADIGGVTAGFGIFFVRIANFVNAELYGRPVPEGGSCMALGARSLSSTASQMRLSLGCQTGSRWGKFCLSRCGLAGRFWFGTR